MTILAKTLGIRPFYVAAFRMNNKIDIVIDMFPGIVYMLAVTLCFLWMDKE
jgi:hypothetical protein